MNTRINGSPGPQGCDLCSDFPATLHPRCHPSAPLRVAMEKPGELVFYCYLPECNREVYRCQIKGDSP